MAPARHDRYEAHFDALAAIAYRVAFRILGDREEARDVAQEAMARAYARWRRIHGYAEPWVARVAANLALGIVRKAGARPVSPGDEPADVAADVAASVADRRLLVNALRDLPARQRDTLILRFVADLPEADVARLLGCSVGTVKSQAHRALQRLRPLVDVDLDVTDTPAIDMRSA
jgi:RNA polymerase sigma-70 factor (sigma-E family)